MSGKFRRNGIVLMCALAALFVSLWAGSAMGDDPVQMSPHKICLNAEGQSDDVQAIVRMWLPSPHLVDFDVKLYFDGTQVAVAESAFYCVIDDNLIIGFDRATLQSNPDVVALGGQEVLATVQGLVTVDGYGVFGFGGSDYVEILKPGKK